MFSPPPASGTDFVITLFVLLSEIFIRASLSFVFPAWSPNFRLFSQKTHPVHLIIYSGRPVLFPYTSCDSLAISTACLGHTRAAAAARSDVTAAMYCRLSPCQACSVCSYTWAPLIFTTPPRHKYHFNLILHFVVKSVEK